MLSHFKFIFFCSRERENGMTKGNLDFGLILLVLQSAYDCCISPSNSLICYAPLIEMPEKSFGNSTIQVNRHKKELNYL